MPSIWPRATSVGADASSMEYTQNLRLDEPALTTSSVFMPRLMRRPRRLRADGVVEREGTVQDAALDLTTVGHLAQCGRVDGRRDLARDRFDGREDRDLGPLDADGAHEIDRVLDDVPLVVERREDVDRRVGDG